MLAQVPVPQVGPPDPDGPRAGDRVRDLTVRGRCFLAAGAAAIICGIQIGERDFVRIGLLAALVPLLAWLLLRRTERDLWVRRNVSDLQVEAGEAAQVEVEIGNAGRRTGTLLLEEELSPVPRGQPQRFVVEPTGARDARRRCGTTGSRPSTGGATRSGPMHVRSADPLGMVDLDQVLPSSAIILVTPRTEPLPQIPLDRRWAGAGDNRTRDLLGGGSPDVTHPGVPPRRRPAPDPLAEQRARRRADGAARGAAVAVAVHAAHRQPAHLPPRLRRALVDGDGRPRGRVDHALPGRARLRGPPGQRHRPVVRRTAGTRVPAGSTCPSSSSAWP